MGALVKFKKFANTFVFFAAFAWLKCEASVVQDRSCYEVLKEVNITGREGSLFGADKHYVRLSLVRSKDDFDLLLRQIKKLVSVETNDEGVAKVSTGIGQSNDSTMMLRGECCGNGSLDFRMELEALNYNGLYNIVDLFSYQEIKV